MGIDPGVPDGHELLFFEEGEPLVDGEPGDLRMRIKTSRDDTFRRDGNDLHMTWRITLVDALVGFNQTFTHFDGRAVALRRTRSPLQGWWRACAARACPCTTRTRSTAT